MKTLLALALFAPAAAAQSVFTVDAAGGPGSTHTTIQAAVNAAIDGDTVLVRPGDYGGFTINGKALVVTADVAGVPKILGHVVVTNLAADETVVLRNFDQLATSSTYGIEISDCIGAVWLEKCSFHGGTGSNATDAVRVFNSDAVTLVRCHLVGGHGIGGFFGAGHRGGSGAYVWNADAALYDCTAVGGDGEFGDDLGGNGGDGLSGVNGSVFVAGGTFFGGNGGGADSDIDFQTGQLVCGLPGHGGSGVASFNAGGFVSATAAIVDIEAHPGFGGDTVEELCFDGADGGLVTGNGDIRWLAGAARGLRIGSPRREGESTNLTFNGEDGDFALALVGASPGFLVLPEVFGALVVDPGFVVLPAGVVPASGVLQVGVVVPQLEPSRLAQTLFVQSAFVTASLELRLGAPSQLTILDAAL